MYVTASDGLSARLVGPWSKEKLDVVGKYMGIFATSMKGKWPGLTYVDLFAGPGRCVVRDTREELPGSPLLALGTKKPFDSVICVEEDATACAALTQRVQRNPRAATVSILPGDCNAIIDRVVAIIPKRHLALVFIDPEGIKGLDVTTIRKLRDRGPVDLIVLFAQNMAINRNRVQWKGQRDTPLDKLLPDWRTTRTPEVRQFTDLLRDLGFAFVDSARRAFRNTTGARLYYLVFASRADIAARFWKKLSGDEQILLL